MITYKDCPECGARKIRQTVSVCEVCETWAKAERRIAFLEREVARLRKGEECHVARPGEGTYECRHDNLCAACRLRSAEARANRTTYTVGETEWAMRVANAEQRYVDEYDAHQETRKLLADYRDGEVSVGKIVELVRAAARELERYEIAELEGMKT